MKQALMVVAVVASVTLVGCAGGPKQGRADVACRTGIDNAYDALSFARSKGFSGSVAWTKASTLLGAAKVQEQVENYSACLDSVKKARFYIKQSQGG